MARAVDRIRISGSLPPRVDSPLFGTGGEVGSRFIRYIIPSAMEESAGKSGWVFECGRMTGNREVITESFSNSKFKFVHHL